METKSFINQYFDRPDAFYALAYKRFVPKEVLDEVAKSHANSIEIQLGLEHLRSEKNRISGQLKNPNFRNSEEGQQAIRDSADIGKKIPEAKSAYAAAHGFYILKALGLPNPPSNRVPEGRNSDDNPIVRVSPDHKTFSFDPKSHFQLLDNLGLIADGVKVAGQGRFPILLGEAAALEDAMRSYFLVHQRSKGRTEVTPPHMVSRNSLTTTGQLPKFEEELYHVYPGGTKDDLFMVPTAEVPLTNLFSGSIIDEADLPIRLFGYSRCFRVEVGSGGKDTQGLKRVHDFGKIEMVDVVRPETSWDALEELVSTAEGALLNLGLDYRVIALCTGDLPSGSAFTYDMETRIPGSDWREISSCTNTLDYQARRGQIRFRDTTTGRVRLAHTLNGSAFPTGRLTASVIEQYQESDGSIAIPEALRPFTNFDHIKKGKSIVSYLK